MPLLAATFAWGYGPSGLGRHRFLQVAGGGGVETALREAIHVLDVDGAVAAYEQLRGSVRGFGPAFLTKFLYFAQGPVVVEPGPLILDARVAAACRSIAVSVLRGDGMDPDLAHELARWQWSDGGWSTYRYGSICSL